MQSKRINSAFHPLKIALFSTALHISLHQQQNSVFIFIIINTSDYETMLSLTQLLVSGLAFSTSIAATFLPIPVHYKTYVDTFDNQTGVPARKDIFSLHHSRRPLTWFQKSLWYQ